MKVILLQDVARIGGRYDVKDVPSGHALNFLIPRKLAMPATPENMKRVEAQKSKQVEDTASRDETFTAALTKLSETKVEMTVEANEQGHLFKGIKAEDIAAQLGEIKVKVTSQQIVLEHAIKEVGEHTITLSSGDNEGTFVLMVTAK